VNFNWKKYFSKKKSRKIRRIGGLDFLRGIAIILVLFRHSNLGWTKLYFFGWLGVDLFFVLSGFLVAGLLFREYIKRDKVNLKKFLVRRGFKIYPPFYFFILASVSFRFLSGDPPYEFTHLRNEIFYLQSYLPRIWLHTWSLAVEEHFYFALAFFMFISVRFNLLEKKKGIILFFIFLLLLTFNMRFNISNFHRHENFGFMETHLRADGIIIGVLIAYLYNFTDWLRPVLTHYKIYLILALFLILPGFVFEGGHYVINTFGLTYINLGFGILVILSLRFEEFINYLNLKIVRIIFKMFCYIGLHSYSIYLWHYSLKTVFYQKFSYSEWIMTPLYFIITILVGIIFSIVIEKPFLKVRDSEWMKNLLAEKPPSPQSLPNHPGSI